MESWGVSEYGDPCRDCGFEWAVTPGQAIGLVREFPVRFTELLAGRSGYERHPELGWTAAGYVSHVTDNLRNWAERLAGARLAGVVRVPGYDPDELGRARRYDEIPAAAALWSLRPAVEIWVESVSASIAQRVDLQHETRGLQRAEDVARTNAHDGVHHVWDVERILAHTDGAAPA